MGRSKVAVTVVAPAIVTTHDPVPEQLPPLQPVKTDPPAGNAERVTTVLGLYASEQSTPHPMRLSELETAPEPVPFLATVSV